MSDQWYYVLKGNRHGPVSMNEMGTLMKNGELKGEDFVWKKGFENWRKLREVDELNSLSAGVSSSNEEIALPDIITTSFALSNHPENEKVWSLKIGADRGKPAQEYGAYSLSQLKKLFNENRINGKTLVFSKGMQAWTFLGDMSDYQSVFGDEPPKIQEEEKRKYIRKPFVARILFANQKKVYEGVCRDISVGGMQILVDEFPGKMGDKISFNVHPENSDYHFVASGEIIRVLDGGQGFAFRFGSLSDDARRSIEKYISQSFS